MENVSQSTYTGHLLGLAQGFDEHEEELIEVPLQGQRAVMKRDIG
jgi:hypothetical protein